MFKVNDEALEKGIKFSKSQQFYQNFAIYMCFSYQPRIDNHTSQCLHFRLRAVKSQLEFLDNLLHQLFVLLGYPVPITSKLSVLTENVLSQIHI